jgi:RecG-like helicase
VVSPVTPGAPTIVDLLPRPGKSPAIKADLDTPLAEIGRAKAVAWLAAQFDIGTVADLLACFPDAWVDPPPLGRILIRELRVGDEALIYGKVLQNHRDEILLSGHARRSRVIVTSVSDGTGTLKLIWIDDLEPPKEQPRGATIAVRGVPHAQSSKDKIIKETDCAMLDPHVAVVQPGHSTPIPGFDAPLPYYEGSAEVGSSWVHNAILRTLHAVDLSEEPPNPLLLKVLLGLHQPATVNERDWAMSMQGWASTLLRSSNRQAVHRAD